MTRGVPRKKDLSGEFLPPILKIVKESLPGIRGDLQRRISADIADQISNRVQEVYQINVQLHRDNETLTARVEKMAEDRTGERQLDMALTHLENLKGILYGTP